MNLFLILSFIICVSFILMQTLITACYGSRIAGGLAGRPALGTTIQHTFYVASSFFLIIIMPVSGFLIESNISLFWFLQITIISMLLSSLLSYLVLIRINLVQKFFQKVFYYYDDNLIPKALLNAFLSKKIIFKINEMDSKFSINKISFKKFFITFVGYAFITSCYFIVFLISIEFIEYRLTISQFAIVLQGIGTFIISFFVDPMLSRSIDNISVGSHAWISNIYSVLLGRVFALFFMGLLFWLVSLYI